MIDPKEIAFVCAICAEPMTKDEPIVGMVLFAFNSEEEEYDDGQQWFCHPRCAKLIFSPKVLDLGGLREGLAGLMEEEE